MNHADPSWDVRDDVAATSGITELGDKIWFHRTAAAVIDPGRCVGCGGCAAACPSGSIAVADDGLPTLVRMCTGCSFCWDFCPLAGLRTQTSGDALGIVEQTFAARAQQQPDRAQDGGVVTTLVAGMLRIGAIDGAILTRRTSAFRGQPFLATSESDVATATGTVYHQSMPLALLSNPLPPGVRTLAFVGTPCQISVLRALQSGPWRYRRCAANAVTVTVALFCSRSFDPPKLMRSIATRGVALRDVNAVDIRDGVLCVRTPHGTQPVGPVREFAHAALRGCDECDDFAGRDADICAGNVGSDPGWTSILIRTPAGRLAWEEAAGDIDVRPLTDRVAVERTTSRNRSRARRTTPDVVARTVGRVRYREHLAAYADTDRAAVVPPPHRSHHYDIGC